MRIFKILALTSILALPLTAMADPDTKPAPTAPSAVKSTAKTSARHGTARHHSKGGKRSHKPATSK